MVFLDEKKKPFAGYKYIVKFHESFTEGGLVRSVVLEPMIMSDLNTLAKVAEQRTAVLRENYVWRFLGMLSAGLAYAHGMPQPIGPVLTAHCDLLYRTMEAAAPGLKNTALAC